MAQQHLNLTPEQLAWMRAHPGQMLTTSRFGYNPGITIGTGGGGFGPGGEGGTPPISGGTYDPTLPTFGRGTTGPTFGPGPYVNPYPAPTTPTTTTPGTTSPKIDWAKLLGKYGSKAGDIGKLLAELLAARAKGRVDEATTNIQLQKLENEMYQDALYRSIVGRMMQTNWDPTTPPAQLVPYLPPELRGTRDPNAGRDDTYAKSLVSGAEETLAHPPTFNADDMTSKPNWIDKTLGIVSPILSGIGIFGKPNTTPTPTPPNAPTPTSPTAPAPTSRPTTTTSSPTLPPYTSPTSSGAGLITPPDPSDPWSVYMEQQRQRRRGIPLL